MIRTFRRDRERGASMVEFVIVFPLAVLFVLGLIQAGLVYMAKLQLNHATFQAARVGALNNARQSVVRTAVVRSLSPFYQNGGTTNDLSRLATASLRAQLDTAIPGYLNVELLNPSPEAFTDFGVVDPSTGVTYIPNDHLEWRNGFGSSSNLQLRDANLLKVKVVYAYQLKVPLMAGVLRRMMCGGSIGVNAWGNVPWTGALFNIASQECLLYYGQGRIPIESYAIVEMQTRAENRN
jgi:hypothetical protein